MADYHSVLLNAVGKLDPNTAEAAAHTYERARRAMPDGLRSIEPRLPKPVVDVELERFDQAVERVEAHICAALSAACGSRAANAGGKSGSQCNPAPMKSGAWGWPLPVVVIAVGLGGPHVRTTHQAQPQACASLRRAPSVSYVYLRQPVYYRTTQPVGTILIDKSQRFIYVVLPNVVALRYGMGIGPECSTAAGLYVVSRKEEWPGRKRFHARTVAQPDRGRFLGRSISRITDADITCFPRRSASAPLPGRMS